MKTGAFIVIEGGEGAGKGTVLAALSGRLSRDGYDVLKTREPGGTAEGLRLREILLSEAGNVWEPWAELLLMTAARVQHVQQVILPAVAQGRIVISDRFVGSTIAYQGAGRGMPIDEIERLHAVAVGGVLPDLTVLLDIDPQIGIGRSLARLAEQALDESRFEALGTPFHQRVRQSFLDQAAQRPAAHVVIDASQSREVVAETVSQAVGTFLRDRK